MRSTAQWLSEYGLTHQNPVNKRIHLICVPLIYWSLTAVVWPYLYAAVLIFYAFLGWRELLAMAILTALCFALNYAILISGLPLLWLAVAIFVVAWIGQFYGHKIEGKKPAFLDDILFLFIGPLWVARKWRLL